MYSRTQRFEAVAWDRLLAEDKMNPVKEPIGMFDYYINDAAREFAKKKRFSMLENPERAGWGPTTGAMWAFYALAVHYKIDKWVPENIKKYKQSYELLYQNKVKLFNLEEELLKDTLFFIPLGGGALQRQQAELQSLLDRLLVEQEKIQAASAELPLDDDDFFGHTSRSGQG